MRACTESLISAKTARDSAHFRKLASEIGWDTALSGEQGLNRGLGTPLSVAELAQLRRDEQLGRTAALNDGSGSAENAREDEALSRVLMGAELRSK